MRRLALALALLCTPAAAAMTPMWIPGGNPCNASTGCSLEWAIPELRRTMPVYADAFAARSVYFDPRPIRVREGTPIAMMTEGGPSMSYRRLYSGIDTVALGWVAPDGWALVQFQECGNWALVYVGDEDGAQVSYPVGGGPLWLVHGLFAASGFGLLAGGVDYADGLYVRHDRVSLAEQVTPATPDNWQPPPPIAPAAIPLPASLWLMLASIAALTLAWRTR